MKKIADHVSSIICDDIRLETGNKVSLMGVYNSINVRQLPFTMRGLCLAVTMNRLKTDIQQIDVVLKAPGKEAREFPTNEDPTIKRKKGESLTYHLSIVPFTLEKQGTYIWELTINEDPKLRIIHKVDVIEASDPNLK